MPKIVPPPDPTEKEEPGAQIARWLGPDSAYYAGHLDELAQELNANFLPVLDETAHAEADGGTVTVTASAKEYVPVRGAVLKFYDAALFTFEKTN